MKLRCGTCKRIAEFEDEMQAFKSGWRVYARRIDGAWYNCPDCPNGAAIVLPASDAEELTLP